MTDLAALIARLESAPEGSIALDREIEQAVGLPPIPGWPRPFTRSLDAALPGERITLVVHHPERRPRCWQAGTDSRKDGGPFIGWAHTEALARRAAWLKRIEHEREGA